LKKIKKFLIINGPNLNCLGKRQPEIYGTFSLEDIKVYTTKKTNLITKNVETDWFQSNIEGEIVERIQLASQEGYSALIINPAAYSHTSVAILDALKLIQYNVVEVHLSNTHSRESFRQTRLTAKSSDAIIEGLGKEVYFLGIMSQLNEEDFLNV
jgi:3-dehydroquinate dehydratase-2